MHFRSTYMATVSRVSVKGLTSVTVIWRLCCVGTFKVQTKAVGRRVRCFYNVTEPGEYVVHVIWSGDPVPQSPYNVLVFSSDEELDSYVAATSIASTSSSTVSRASSCSVQ